MKKYFKLFIILILFISCNKKKEFIIKAEIILEENDSINITKIPDYISMLSDSFLCFNNNMQKDIIIYNVNNGKIFNGNILKGLSEKLNYNSLSYNYFKTNIDSGTFLSWDSFSNYKYSHLYHRYNIYGVRVENESIKFLDFITNPIITDDNHLKLFSVPLVITCDKDGKIISKNDFEFVREDIFLSVSDGLLYDNNTIYGSCDYFEINFESIPVAIFKKQNNKFSIKEYLKFPFSQKLWFNNKSEVESHIEKKRYVSIKNYYFKDEDVYYFSNGMNIFNLKTQELFFSIPDSMKRDTFIHRIKSFLIIRSNENDNLKYLAYQEEVMPHPGNFSQSMKYLLIYDFEKNEFLTNRIPLGKKVSGLVSKNNKIFMLKRKDEKTILLKFKINF
ncbi:MAG: hypothetical protein U9R42_07650 [Bacteroidota bacterium]|nr:hypothetical protein [Bacteroidota bacterium]